MGLKHNTESDTESYVKKNIVVNESDNKICPDKYIDLHLHLDGAITMDIAKKLAALQKIKLPAENDEQLKKLLTVPDTCTSLNDFLKCFTLPDALMMTQEGISEAVYLVAENIRQQGVIYAEIRFAPQNHTENGMSQEEAVQAALEGLKRTELKANIILCCMRGEGNEEANYETLELTKKYLVEDGGVTGMDLAGAEALYPTSKYAALFAKAREYGIPFTIHAGEAAGAESVECALNFQAVRIGHGVRSTENPLIMQELADRETALELCPTSNLNTKIYDTIENYPIQKLMNKGIKVTVNTDNMMVSNTTEARELALVADTFNMEKKDVKKLIMNGVEAAFTTEGIKNRLRARVETQFAKVAGIRG